VARLDVVVAESVTVEFGAGRKAGSAAAGVRRASESSPASARRSERIMCD
jgi:hypothetical protein